MTETCWCGSPLDEFGRCIEDEAIWAIVRKKLAKAIDKQLREMQTGDPTPFVRPQGTATGLAALPEGEGLKTASRALTEAIEASHAQHPAPCELFTRKMGRCTCPPDPTEQETHP